LQTKIEPVHVSGDDELLPPAAPQTQAVFLWAVATALGLFVYNLYFQFLLLNRLNSALAGPPANTASLALLLVLIPEGVSQGFIVGAAQWSVLRRYVKSGYAWIVLSVLGWTAFYCLDFAYLGLAQRSPALAQAVGGLGPTGALLLFEALRGLLIGLCQSVALRRWGRPALLWVPIVIIGQAASVLVARLLSDLPAGPAIGWIAEGLVLGLGLTVLLNVCWAGLLARGQVLES
jgi:hypothetical protein